MWSTCRKHSNYKTENGEAPRGLSVLLFQYEQEWEKPPLAELHARGGLNDDLFDLQRREYTGSGERHRLSGYPKSHRESPAERRAQSRKRGSTGRITFT